MIWGLVRRELRARYVGSVFGGVWSLLYPFWLLLVYFVVFSLVLKVRFTADGGQGDFAFYLLAGLLPWLAFQDGVTKAATSLVDHAGLVKAVRFPAGALVASSVLASGTTLLISLAIFLLALLFLGHLSWTGVLFLPVLVSCQLVLALGIGLVVASLHAFLRDTVPALQMIFMVWFYLTPIIYPLSYIPAQLVPLFVWNPFTSLVTAYRAVLLEGLVPSGTALLPACVWTVGAVLLGCLVFTRLESDFADVL